MAPRGRPFGVGIRMVVHVTRFISVAVGVLSGFTVARFVDWFALLGLSPNMATVVLVVLGWSMGYVIGGIVGRELDVLAKKAEARLRAMTLTDLILSALGLLAGSLMSVMLAWPLRAAGPFWLVAILTVGLFLLLGYVSIRIALLKSDEVATAFPRLSGSYPESLGEKGELFLDTSALIDGRFVELHSLGYLNRSLRVPRFVLGELQTLADSADAIKRARGRRGLDLLSRLADEQQVVRLFETDYSTMNGADDKLIELARETSGAILTVDSNLAAAARILGVEVLNVNEAATSLRPTYLPGEPLAIIVRKVGKENDQGVGYLDDGTMVVIPGAAHLVGEEIETSVTSVLQTSGGRMIFAHWIPGDESGAEQDKDAS